MCKIKVKTEQFEPYWDENNSYPFFKKGKLKRYYSKKFVRKFFKDYLLE